MSKTNTAALLLFLTVAAVSASAQTTYTVNMTFKNPHDGSADGTLSGTFTVNGGSVTGSNFSLTGCETTAYEASTQCVDIAAPGGTVAVESAAGCPGDAQEIVFFSNLFVGYATVCLSSVLGPSGASVDAAQSTACGGTDACAVGIQGSVTSNQPPTISKAFGVGTISAGQTTSLTFTLGNAANPSSSLTNVSFTDSLPTGLLVSGPVTNHCGGTVSASGDSISVSGVTLAGGASCTIVVNVLALTAGEQYTAFNITSYVSAGNSPLGLSALASIVILPEDAVQIGYTGNLKAGDSYVDITDAGQNLVASCGANCTSNPVVQDTDICANVYVFAQDQQLIACCTCPLTLNHLKTLSAQQDLIGNTLTPGVPIGITTILVASTGNSGTCDAVNPGPLVAGLRAWGTTLHAAPGGTYATTENTFRNVGLSQSEFSKMTANCAFIEADGSGAGICGSCKEGAAGAAKQ